MSGRVVTKEVIRSQGEAYTSEVRLRKCAESFAPPKLLPSISQKSALWSCRRAGTKQGASHTQNL